MPENPAPDADADPLRILLLTETLCAGGAETFVVRLANALFEAGHEVMIAVMLGGRVHPALAARIAPGLAVERLHVPLERWLHRADRLLRMMRIDLPLLHGLQRRWLKSVVARWRPDVVHSHLVKADWLASALKARGAGFRHVLTNHGDYLAYEGDVYDPQMLDYARRATEILGRADGIALISDDQAQHFHNRFRLGATAVARIYNGYAAPTAESNAPLRAELGLPEGKLLFGMISRGIPEKGWSEAIAAFQQLGRNDCVLVLVGEGPFFDRLGEPPPGVILAGFSAEPVACIRHFDVGLLPSTIPSEGLPTVIVEYLACGVPVIATDVGEIAAMLRAPGGEMAGKVIPLGDRPTLEADLASAMADLASDAELRARLSALAPLAFAKFAMADCLAAYIDLYRGSASSSSNKANH